MAQASRKSELIAELAAARHSLSANVRGLERGLDVGQRLATLYHRHSIACLTGAGVLGFVLARLPARRGKVAAKPHRRKPAAEEKVMKAGLLVTVLKIAFDLTRPVLTKWVAQRVAAYADGRAGARH